MSMPSAIKDLTLAESINCSSKLFGKRMTYFHSTLFSLLLLLVPK